MAPETDSPETAPVADPAAVEKPKLAIQVEVDKPSTCKRHVTVTVPRDDIERYFREAFDELQPTAEVPGFRPGKAPRRLVESKFRDQMKRQVKGSLLMDSVSQASEECDFSAISEPDFDFEAIELPDEGPMTFEFDIEVRPEFDMPQWKSLPLSRPEHEYSDDEVDQHLKKILGRYAKIVPKDGTVEADNNLLISITFQQDGNVVSQLPSTNVAVRSRLSFSDGNIEEFADLVTGAQKGDRKSTKVTVGEHAVREDLRGVELDAEVLIEGIYEVELPELSSSFLESIGGFEDEDDLRSAVRQELEQQLAYHQQQRMRDQITNQLTKDADWDLPEDLVKRQARRELQRAVLELQSRGFSDPEIIAHRNRLQQNSVESTKRALKEHFILERIAEEEEIDASTEDFDREIGLIARQSDSSIRKVRARLEKRGQMDALRNQIVENKVVDLITSFAVITDQPFDPHGQQEDAVALDHAICGVEDDEEIPEAKYGGDAEALRTPAERG